MQMQKTVTIRELIKELLKYDLEEEVCIGDRGNRWYPIKDFYRKSNGKVLIKTNRFLDSN